MSDEFPRAQTLPGGYWRDPATRRFTRRPRDEAPPTGSSSTQASRRSRAQPAPIIDSSLAVSPPPVPSAPPLEPSAAQALQYDHFFVDSGEEAHVVGAAEVHVARAVGARSVEQGILVSSAVERGVPVVAVPVVNGVPVVPQVLSIADLVDAGAEVRWGPGGFAGSVELLIAESCYVASWARFVDALLWRCVAVARWRSARGGDQAITQWAELGSLSLEPVLESLERPPRGVLRALDWLRALWRLLGVVLRVARRAGWSPVGSTAVGLTALVWHLTEESHEQPGGEPAPERD